MIICICVNDRFIFGANMHIVKTKKQFSHFEKKDLGVLGIKLRKNNDSLSLCQPHYIGKMIRKLNCFNVTYMRTSYNPNMHLKRDKFSTFPELGMLKL